MLIGLVRGGQRPRTGEAVRLGREPLDPDAGILIGRRLQVRQVMARSRQVLLVLLVLLHVFAVTVPRDYIDGVHSVPRVGHEGFGEADALHGRLTASSFTDDVPPTPHVGDISAQEEVEECDRRHRRVLERP